MSASRFKFFVKLLVIAAFAEASAGIFLAIQGKPVAALIAIVGPLVGMAIVTDGLRTEEIQAAEVQYDSSYVGSD
jgi:hypothetical protein